LSGIVYLIERLSLGIYPICLVVFLVYLRRWFIHRRKLAIAEFELEREFAERIQAGAITWAIASIQLALAVFAIANVIAPTIRADLIGQTSSNPGASSADIAGDFKTSTPGGDGSDMQALNLTLTARAIAAAGGQQILLTAVASPTPVGTMLVGYPTPTDCQSPNAWLEIPGTGQLLFDSVTVIGTANVPNFAFYKFEIAGPSTGGAFAPILGDRTSPVVQKGPLGQLQLSVFQTGDYQFRLAVFDNTGVLRASCTVSVRIQPRPPTATPPGGGTPVPVTTP